MRTIESKLQSKRVVLLSYKACTRFNLYNSISVCLDEKETSISKGLLNEQKLRKAEKYVETSILKLPSKTCIVKYSVIAEANNVDTVTIFSVKRSQKTAVSCVTSCQMQQGKERTVQNINKSDNLCLHIKLMKEQKTFEDIPESEGSSELPDQFLEDEIFENFDG